MVKRIRGAWSLYTAQVAPSFEAGRRIRLPPGPHGMARGPHKRARTRARRWRGLTPSPGRRYSPPYVSVTVEDTRVEELLRIIVAAASGDYAVRVALEERDDVFLEVELGVNYMLEELCLGSARNDRQRDELTARARELGEQQDELLEALSTPILAVWPGVLALPLIGRIDDQRAATITATLLERVAGERASHIIIDLTGVSAIAAGTMPAILRMVRAIGLLGATCLLTGIHPGVARQIVELGAEDLGVRALARLSDALALVLAQKGVTR
jgi:rsbT co-antagonist protein RsbR